ncbi:MAG TPA: hypothetical protein VJK09_01115 [Candidatus Paceibacterota bacterium]
MILVVISVIKNLIAGVILISRKKYDFAFLIHSRDIRDIYRKYKFARYLPESLVNFVALHMWPVFVSSVTGLMSKDGSGRELHGVVIGLPITAHQMIEHRELALKKIRQAVRLSEKYGAKIVGLGALTSSMSRGGLDLVGTTKTSITTGHAYTGHTVFSYARHLTSQLGLDKKNCLVAIVGATGSIGSITAQLLARDGYINFILIDLERKGHKFSEIIDAMLKLSPNAHILTSHHIIDVREADLIVTATNAPEALIHAGDLKSGAIVIDDAQPSDVALDALDREDVLIVEAGIVSTPGVSANFNFGLKSRTDNFCCLCEVMILASSDRGGHYVINRATLEQVDEIAEGGRKLGFSISRLQNFKEVISDAKIEHVSSIIRNRPRV